MAAVAFTSCNVNDEIDDGNEPVRFTAGIDQQAVANAPAGTRAAGTTWGNDAIGIFMTESGTTHYANSKYTTTGDGKFTAAAGSEMYYPMSGNTVTFTAYYPYESGAALGAPIDVEIETTQTTGNQPAFDLLYSSGATGSKATAASPVALDFKHQLSKIVMNTTADASVGSALAGMTVTIKGMNTKNTFNLATGALGATSNTPAPITPRTVTDGTQYDAIIMPGSYSAGDVTVDFTVGSETFTWTLPATTFAPGNEYTYTVTLKRTGVQVTGTITAWITGGANDRGNVDAE